MSTSEYSNPTGTSESTAGVDADAVARAKREIQGLVQEIAELSRSDATPEKFYDAMLNRVVAALAAPGGAVWTTSDSGALQLVYQINLQETGLADNPVGQSQHARLLYEVLQGNDGALVAPHSGHGDVTDDDEQAAANPTDFLLVLGPVHNDQGAQGVVEVFQRAGARPATQRGYLRFLLQTCELAGDYLRSRRLSHLSEKQSLWEQLESFTRLAHEKLEVRQTAYTVANEGRRLIGCDRVSVAVQRGGRCPIEAVSGQDTFDKRSNVTVMLSKLARAVTKTGEDVWYTGDTTDLAPQVEKALDAYVDESHTKAMAILPLTEPRDEEDLRDDKRPAKVLGALIVEQMVDSRPPEGFQQRVDVVRSHTCTALNNAMEYEGLFLLPVWRTLGKGTAFFRGRKLPKTLAVIGLIVAVIAAACLVPADFALQGDGLLRPKVRRNVYAHVDGEIVEVLVQGEMEVAEGQLLIRQRSFDLEMQQKALVSELTQTAVEIQTTRVDLGSSRRRTDAESDQMRARLAQLQEQLVSLQTRLELLNEKQSRLEIKSPIKGTVITWQPVELLQGRPVTAGARLLEIADPTADWELEVFMPESRMSHVTRAWQESDGDLAVTFILTTDPGEDFEGRVVEVDVAADVNGEEGNTVRMRVDFDQQRLREVIADPKVNSEATAKIHCGNRPVGYVWLHDLIDAFKRHVLFRLR